MKTDSRLYSLDLLRGLDMFLLTAVAPFVGTFSCWQKLPEGVLNHFHHAYTGFVLYDIIMPLFIFMCGAAVPFALGKRLADGKPTGAYWRHVLGRFLLLWVLGMVVQGGLLTLDPAKIQFFSNTLQTIAIGYVAAAGVLLIPSRKVRFAVPIACFVLYGIILALGGDYGEQTNLAMRLDKAVFSRIMPGFASQYDGRHYYYAWILPSFMYVAMTTLGLESTEIIRRTDWGEWKRAGALFALAAALLAAGFFLSFAVPVIKPVFSVSFTAYAMGWSVLALAVLYVVADIWKFRRGTGLLILYGQCALAAYLVFEIFGGALRSVAMVVTQGFERFMGPEARMVWVVVAMVAVQSFVLFVWRAFKGRNRR